MKINKKRGKKISTFGFYILFLIIIIPLVTAVDNPPDAFFNPSKDNSIVKSISNLNPSKEFAVSLFTGAVTYNFPIEVPKGTNDLTPLVSINYNSQADNKPGIFGTSWALTENYIQRIINYTRNTTYDDEFKLVFNGQVYDLTYDTSGGLYHTEIESYFYIKNFSGGNNTYGQYWIVKNKDGTSYRLGFNNDSEQISNQENYTVRWYLDLVNDAYNNKIFYSYRENPNSGDAGITYPYKIEYNNDKQRVIEFILDNSNRPDLFTYYDQSSLINITRRLKEIQIKANNSLVKKYVLNYDYLDTRSFLKNISVYGSDNASIFYSETFSYYIPQKGWYQTDYWKSPDSFIGIAYDDAFDEGVRFGDVNRDGYMDIIEGYKVFDSDPESTTIRINNKTNGWDIDNNENFPHSFVVTDWGELYGCPSMDAQYGINRGILSLDLNGDGFEDLLVNPHSNSGSWSKIDEYVNNTAFIGLGNSTWIENISFALSGGKGQIVRKEANYPSDTPPCYVVFGVDRGVRFADLNGDGLVDEIEESSNGLLNTGNGWYQSSDWYFPEDIIFLERQADTSCKYQYGIDVGTKFIDINGDGLDDAIISRKVYGGYSGGNERKILINNGKNFVEINWTIPEYFVDDKVYGDPICYTRYGVDQGVRLADVNGDGFVDIIKGQGSDNKVYINNGSGWKLDNDWILPANFVNSLLEDQGTRLVDVNGDGLIDIIKSTNSNKTTWLNNASKPYLLKNITTKYGGFINIDYTKSSNLDNKGEDNVSDLGFNAWVVSNITEFNGMNNSHNITSIIIYNYSGGKYDYYPKNEFRGFSYAEEKIGDKKIEHHFYQDDGKKGKEYRTETLNSQNNPYIKKEYIFNSTQKNGYYITLLSEESEYTFDGNLTNPKIKNLSYNYDEFGNIIKKWFKGDVNDISDDKYEYYNYLNNSNIWIINKIKNYSLFNNNSIKVKGSLYSYDNQNYGQVPTKGSFTRREDWLNMGGENPVTEYGYDVYGNLINQTDANNHTTKYVYGIRDSTNTFVDQIINAKNQILNYYYDLGTGNLLSVVDANGYATNYTYDVFGRKTSEILPYDSLSYPTIKYEYDFDGISPEKIKISKQEISGINNTLDSYSFYDGFGRTIQIKSEAENQKQIITNYFYDNNGRIKSKSNPYFINYFENYSFPNSSINNMSYEYDILDRIIKIINPDNTYKNLTYNHWNITIFDENEHEKDYQIDAYNKIIKVLEHNNGNVYITEYQYDPSGNLIEIQDAKGNIFNYTYDSLGRKIKMKDPDLGIWNYSYDKVGNILKQVDNKNITILMEYDELNRIIKKISDEENISYTYDINKNNSLSMMETKSSITNYTYDNRLRKVSEINIIDGIKFIMNYSYDAMDRITLKILPDKSNITYNYNNQGKVGSINDILNISYNELNKPATKLYKNGLITNYTYKTDSLKLMRIKTSDKQDLNYDYDFVGNIKSINDTANLKKYLMNYDNLNRLVFANLINYSKGENKTINYSYNEIGNMLNITSNNENISFSYGNLAHAPISIFITSENPLNITLIEPLNNTENEDGIVQFNFSFSSVNEIQNCSLWSDFSGIWESNQTLPLYKRAYGYNSQGTIISPENVSDNSYGDTLTESILYPGSNFTLNFKLNAKDNITVYMRIKTPSENYYCYNWSSNQYVQAPFGGGRGCFSMEYANSSMDFYNDCIDSYGNISFQIRATSTCNTSISDIYIKYHPLSEEQIINFEKLNLGNGLYKWNVKCFDKEGLSSFGINNWTLNVSKIVLPNDPHKTYHKDALGNTVAWLGNQGNIVLKGKCFSGGNCNNPGDGSIIFRNDSNYNLGFINVTGDLCIIKGDCSDKSANCNSPADGAFIIANSTDYTAYIDGEGDLCLVGGLYENADL
ncbi:hypothetical protein J4429_05310 [Candidatus Pacearchaeota archaeon]|nr:hypothetical protein [Candidatus Pacearchaeota archaeon]